ncbi:hypothetical protein PGTUg99_019457 [Puccinia graminis f. sp. tritici]|uniref:Uncharacterized protein n=1 Tax=Puccinia graminis f. sp. tritici TaxID=56615 RepID=A0A5B0NEV6_PUCGR|nr:hypothetical protein PGTUg99_019457 [Puccinia graminis f. sp. tritici]
MAVIFKGLMFINTHGPQEILIFDKSDWNNTHDMMESVRRELSDKFWTNPEESHRTEKPLVDYKNWGLRVNYSGKDNVAYITNYGDRISPLHWQHHEGHPIGKAALTPAHIDRYRSLRGLHTLKGQSLMADAGHSERSYTLIKASIGHQEEGLVPVIKTVALCSSPATKRGTLLTADTGDQERSHILSMATTGHQQKRHVLSIAGASHQESVEN